MANQNNKDVVDTMVETQKNAVDTMAENTKKFTNGNNLVNETVQKGSEWYKNWLDNQKNIFTKVSEKGTNLNEDLQKNATQMNEYYQNWFNTQMNQAKQMWEMNNSYFQNAMNSNKNAATSNPMEMWNNMTNNWNNWMSNMNNTQNWFNGLQQWNNMFNIDAYKNASQNWTGIFNQYNDILNNGFAKFQENLQNGTTQDVYKNMMNATEGFTKFYEMWMPMWKSIQDKTFNMEVYKQWMNPVAYKDMMDKYFGFMPENSRQYMQQASEMFQNNFKQASQNNWNNYEQVRNMLNQAMPVNTTEMFGNMMSGYNAFYNNMNEATAPFTKMMTPNAQTKTLVEWQDLSNRIAVYNIKNAELQYMMYTQGTKVMDNLAQNIATKIQKGQDVNSIMALYQEWMNISDKTFVELFESDAYSQLMAEVSAMQLKLRKDIEMQMEKFMTGIPVATRSEMDEMYKTIYDLKKQVRQLEKMLDLTTEEVAEDAKTATAKKATTKK
ncbi:MAG TPA: poly(R)-hydroxyalkanoic acid synthase subunit PhaE [Flavipsychrobacter sp.]|nr:poly(R)-hydroxyalkanoic acid synthase subunit PhaE [Flavipsychrobacter sp.]